MAESTVFGGIAGDVMVDWLVGRERPRLSERSAETAAEAIRRPLGRTARDEAAPLRRELRDLMWEEVGLVRTGAGLTRALGRIDELEDRLAPLGVPGGSAFNLAWQGWLDARSQTLAARLIARSALERRESRGAHYRADHPESDNDHWLVTVTVRRREEGVSVRKAPIPLTRAQPGPLAPSEMIEVGD